MEGIIEGEIKGEINAKMEAVPGLLKLGLTVEPQSWCWVSLSLNPTYNC